MNQLVSVLVLLVLVPITGADEKDAVRKELKALVGTWKAVEVEAGGEKLPKESVPTFLFIVKANGKAIGKTDKGEYKATLSVDPGKSPKTINNFNEDGPQKGKTQWGIYTLNDKTWKVCMSRPGVAESERPTDFKTKGTTHVVFTFERQPEKK